MNKRDPIQAVVNFLHYPSAFRALDKHINQYNEKAPDSTRRLKAGAVLTAKELFRLYGASLLKPKTRRVDCHFPPLSTNNGQLASLVRCSRRTIQRYIGRLAEAGIVTRKVCHGSHADYELWLNPGILTEATMVHSPVHNPGITTAKSPSTITKPLSFKEVYTTILPPPYSTGNNNNIIIGRENVENRVSNIPRHVQQAQSLKKGTGYVTGNMTGNTGKIALCDKTKGREVKMEKTGKIASRADRPKHSNEVCDTARGNFLNLQVNLLWMMARSLLYKKTDLTDHQVVTAKQLIHKLYEPVPPEDLWTVHQIYVERIALVHQYIQRDPTRRFVPLPYIFFDTNNPHGFTGTRQWHEVHRQWKKTAAKELSLKRAIRVYAQNEAQPPKYRQMPLKLFRYCEKTIASLDPALLPQFYAAVLEHETGQCPGEPKIQTL